MYKDTRLFDTEKWYHAPPEDANMRIPEELVHCVVFICVEIASGPKKGRFQPFGTGFIITVTEDNQRFGYLVTSKHVLKDALDRGYTTAFARLNTKDRGVDYINLGSINLDDWHTSENPAVDIALIPFFPDSRKFHFSSLPHKMFATSTLMSKRRIGQGDDLYFSGLLTRRSGNKISIPIVRTGIIAAMNMEPLPGKKEGEFYDAFLAEMRSIGGLSGSPVFVYLDKRRVYDANIEGDYIFILLGMIRGHWDLKREIDQDSDLSEDVPLGFNKGENLNVGIAVVTPAYDILEILFYNDLIQERRESTMKILRENEITEDSSLEDVSQKFTSDAFQEALKKASQKVSQPDTEKKETSE